MHLPIRVEEIVQNVDLAPTFLDIAGVPVPPHMDGKSIMPLIINRHRSIKFKWPDTFLIESSGRRETPEQLAEQRARAHAAKYSQLLNENNNKMEISFPENRTAEILKNQNHDGSHEMDDDEDDDLEDEEELDSDFDTELQRDEPRRKTRDSKFELFSRILRHFFTNSVSFQLTIIKWIIMFHHINQNWNASILNAPILLYSKTAFLDKSGNV